MKFKQVVAIAGMFLFTCTSYAETPGSIVGWGLDDYNQISHIPFGMNYLQVSGGSRVGLALRSDGSIASWGEDYYDQISDTPIGFGFAQVASGSAHSLALRGDGSIASWGADTYDLVSDTPTGTGFAQIASGGLHSLALKEDGSIISWGNDYYMQVSHTPTGYGFVQIAGGGEHSLALKEDGSIVSWGDDRFNQVGNTPNGTDFVQVAGGFHHSLALRSNGSIVSWGQDDYGQVSETPTSMGFVQIASGGSHSLALKDDGSIVSWGSDWDKQVSNTPSGTGFAQVGGGYHFNLAILETATVWEEWSDDPTMRTPVSMADNRQGHPRLVQAHDGFVVTWQDFRRDNIHNDIYAQKLSLDGEALWPVNGRVVAEGPANSLVYPSQLHAGLVHDGSGGALLGWNDAYDPSYFQAFVSNISSDATVQWGVPGEQIQADDTAVPLLANPTRGTNRLPESWPLVADSEGGLFVPLNTGAGRLAADGVLRTNWFNDPSDARWSSLAMVPVLESAGKDGFIVVWNQGNQAFSDGIRARKLVDPEISWPAARDVLSDSWGQLNVYTPDYNISVCKVTAVPDGSGGVIAVWMDDRVRTETTHFRIYAQRIDSEGNLLWPEGGVEISSDVMTYTCYWWQKMFAAADGEGGVVIAWNDDEESVKAQRVGSDGSTQWTEGGVTLVTDNDGYTHLTTHGLVRATDGNFIVLYHHEHEGRLVAQKLGPAQGETLWGEGKTVYEGCFYPYNDGNAPLVSDGYAGAVAAWTSCDGDIYAHRLIEKVPVTYEIDDIDQSTGGLSVSLEVSINDDGGLQEVDYEAENVQVVVEDFEPGTPDPVILMLQQEMEDLQAWAHLMFVTLQNIHEMHVSVIRNLSKGNEVTDTLVEAREMAPVTFVDVKATESNVRVVTLEPGLRKLDIVVNGEVFTSLKKLNDNQQIELDISSALHEGDNTVTLIGYGKVGQGAVVLIGP